MLLDAIYWNADPVLFSLGPISVRWYGLAFAVGFIIGYDIVARMYRHEGAPERWLGILLAYVLVATVVGARLGHVFFYEWDYYGKHPAEILKIWNGGESWRNDCHNHSLVSLLLDSDEETGIVGV